MSDGGSSGSSGGACSPTGDPLIDKYVCCPVSGSPPPAMVVPTPEQAAYQHVELTGFLHFGIETFSASDEQQDTDPATTFAPTALDQAAVDSWMTELQNAGFGQAMLVTKHSAGFCLWPSKTTTYTVAHSGWMNGTGDVVKMFSTSAAAHGMRAAYYLSPWDSSSQDPSSSNSYQQAFTTQQMELLSYGKAYEIEFDGFNSPGSHGTPPTVSWPGVFAAAKQLQPHIAVWSGPEISQLTASASPPVFPDLQWIGNESGNPASNNAGQRTTSSLNLAQCAYKLDSSGNPSIQVGKNLWCPMEATTSAFGSNWFWHPGQTPISVGRMEQVYFNTVGMNGTVNINFPPSQTGSFDANETKLLSDFGTWYHSTFQTDLLKGAPAMADSTWATAGFDASMAVDDNVCTYWAAANGMTTGTLTVTPASPINLKVISIREPIEMGERVTQYHVEINQNGSWSTPSDATTNCNNAPCPVQGSVIGNRQLWQMGGQSVTGIRLVIESASAVPLIAEFAAY